MDPRISPARKPDPVSRADIARALGARIAQRREELGKTQAEIAALLQPHRSKALVSEMERGKHVMSVARLYEIAEALGTTAEALISGLPVTRTGGQIQHARNSHIMPAG